jgi:hypothetical protein
MINPLTGGIEFKDKKKREDLDIEGISELDINENYNPVPSLYVYI